MKISQAIEGYWLTKKLDFSPHTVNRYGTFFRHLTEYLGDVEFEAITTNDLRRFLIYLSQKPNERSKDGQPLSRRTVHDTWVSLMSLWTWAEKELGTPHILRGRIHEPDFDQVAIEPLTEDEIRQLVKAVGARQVSRDKAIILVLLDTGIRAQELCNLKVKDYDPERGRLHIRHSKNDRARFVILGNRARRSLWRYLADRKKYKPGDPLFATDTGNHLQRDNLRHLLERAGERAGIDAVHPHKFRHTMALAFLRNGGNLLVLQELLGHSSLSMVKRYAKIAALDIEQAAQFSPADNMKI